jgi:glycosyltransferase involved in cell wall biosynthesis
LSGHISWFTPPLPQNQGYGIAAVETIKALQRNGLKVSWNAGTPYVHVNFIQPEYYQGHDDQYKIGYTPWESTGIPPMWPFHMRRMQEIWTTSTFCQQTYKDVGVESIVIPHGFDPEIFKISERTLTNKFVFLHIGGPTERKGGKMVAQAFIDFFSDRDDVFLIMKSHGPSEARWIDKNGYHGSIKNHPRVQVVEEDLNITEFVKLYELAHCLVYPTNGEGFGLIPFQGIATGLPTITTNLTGTADFAELSMPLEADWDEGWGVHEGLWAKPNYLHLRRLMTHVVENWEAEKIRAVQSAHILHNTQTWDHVAKKIIDHLGDKVDLTLAEV